MSHNALPGPRISQDAMTYIWGGGCWQTGNTVAVEDTSGLGFGGGGQSATFTKWWNMIPGQTCQSLHHSQVIRVSKLG